MKREDFLPEQKKVLDCTNKNLIVSASAGSGKTTVMIQKIIELITEQNKSIKNFLVLTYTILAADEMKQKLVNALYEKVLLCFNEFQIEKTTILKKENLTFTNTIDIDTKTNNTDTANTETNSTETNNTETNSTETNSTETNNTKTANIETIDISNKDNSCKNNFDTFSFQQPIKKNLLKTNLSEKHSNKKNLAKLEKKYLFLLNQIDEVMTADISTIHSFFQRLIKKHFMLLNLNPNFKIIEENQSQVLKNQAFKNSISIYSKTSNENLNQLLDIYGKKRNEKTIFKLIEKIDMILKAIDNPEFWCENIATKFCEVNLNKNYAIEVLNKSFCDAAKYYKQTFKKLLFEAEKYKKDEEHLCVYVEMILKQLDLIYLDEHDIEKSFFKNYNIYREFDFKILKRSNDNPELYEEIFLHREKLKSYINNLKSYDYSKEKIDISIKLIKQNIESLLDLYHIFDDEYTRLKKEINSLDYNDLERYALELAKNDEVCKQISKQYSHFFVDEYQDANRLQEKILSAFASNNLRFMVGDVKQSIYGFRQAEPDIFLNIQKEFSSASNSDVMFLNSNFRSHPKILSFINLVFSNIMTENTAKLNYAKTSQLQGQLKFPELNEIQSSNIQKENEQIDFLNNVYTENEKLPNVEIDIIKTSKGKKILQIPKFYSVKEHSRPSDEMSLLNENESRPNIETDEEIGNAEKEGILIAQKISELVGKKFYDTQIKSFREIEFKDISILLNSRGEYLDKLCKILTSFNIPIYANAKKSLLEDEDIYTLIHLLELCKNFNNDIALAVSLHSIFGGFSYSELAKIKLLTPTFKFFYENVDYVLNNIAELKSNKVPSTSENINDKETVAHAKKLATFLNLNDKKENTNFMEKEDTTNLKENKVNINFEQREIENICEKLVNFKQLIDNLKFNIRFKGINFALNKIINSYDYYAYLYSKSGGLEKANNLKKFLNDFLQSTYNHDLIGFLNFVQECPENIKAPNYLNTDNCININTIHSSKGLEFPIVFLANSGSSFEGKSDDAEIAINLNFGIGLKFYNPDDRTQNMSFIFDAISKLNDDAEFAEKLRLLYVALTRAKNFLFIVGSANGDFDKLSADFEIKQKRNFLELIIGALPEKTINKINLNQDIISNELIVKVYSENVFLNDIILPATLINSTNIEDKIFFDKKNKKGEFKNSTLNDGDLCENKQDSFKNHKNQFKEKLTKGSHKEKCIKIFENIFNQKIPTSDDVALKNSVTSISRENELDFTSINPSPKSLKVFEHLNSSPSEIGILYHKVLETINFQDFDKKNNVNSCESESENFNTQNLLSKKTNKITNYKNQIEKQVFKIIANNFSKNQEQIDLKKIAGCIQCLQKFRFKNMLKEQKFMMYLPHNEIVKNGSAEKILIQGIADLILLDAEIIDERKTYQSKFFSQNLQNSKTFGMINDNDSNVTKKSGSKKDNKNKKDNAYQNKDREDDNEKNQKIDTFALTKNLENLKIESPKLKNILIDYKYTSVTDENILKKRYSLQLSIYKKAIEMALNIKIDEVFLLLINNQSLLKISV